MKADLFDMYCRFVFDILTKVEKRINLYDKELVPGATNARWAGFLAERLTAIFIFHQINCEENVAEFPAVCLVPDVKYKVVQD